MIKYATYAPVSDFPTRKGSALQFGGTVKKNGVVVGTVEMAAQTKPKPQAGSSESPFDWKDTKLFMQLDDGELGKLLSVLRGRLNESKIIHKFPMDAKPEEQTTSSLTFTRQESGDVGVSMQQKKVGEKDFTRYSIFLKPEDGEILIVLFTEIIKHMYEVWSLEPRSTEAKTVNVANG